MLSGGARGLTFLPQPAQSFTCTVNDSKHLSEMQQGGVTSGTQVSLMKAKGKSMAASSPPSPFFANVCEASPGGRYRPTPLAAAVATAGGTVHASNN
jgi:hypothetical protein